MTQKNKFARADSKYLVTLALRGKRVGGVVPVSPLALVTYLSFTVAQLKMT